MLRRRTLGTLVATLAVAAGVPLVAGPAHAASYRFWSYWDGDSGSWTFSRIGADSSRLTDGAVEGWRFAVSPGTTAAPQPRISAASVWGLDGCRGKTAGEDEIRAAVVIDFGDPDDYADGQQPPSDPVRVWCGVLPKRSTGMDLLNAAASGALRTDGGMICGISGFPSRGCGEPVADPAPTRTPSPKPTADEPTKAPQPTRTARPTSTQRPSESTRPATAATPPGHDPTAATTAGAVSSSGTRSTGPTDGPTPTTSATSGTEHVPADATSPTPVVGLPVSAETAATGTPWPAVLVAVLLAALAGTTYWRRRSR